MAGADLGRDGGDFSGSSSIRAWPKAASSWAASLPPADQPRSVQLDVQIGENVARLQAARPFFQLIELSRRIGAAVPPPPIEVPTTTLGMMPWATNVLTMPM